MNLELDSVTASLLAILLAFLGGVLFVRIISRLSDFSRKLETLNMEIARTEGRERQLWKRKKRRLWLSLLPFYRR